MCDAKLYRLIECDFMLSLFPIGITSLFDSGSSSQASPNVQQIPPSSNENSQTNRNF